MDFLILKVQIKIKNLKFITVQGKTSTLVYPSVVMSVHTIKGIPVSFRPICWDDVYKKLVLFCENIQYKLPTTKNSH